MDVWRLALGASGWVHEGKSDPLERAADGVDNSMSLKYHRHSRQTRNAKRQTLNAPPQHLGYAGTAVPTDCIFDLVSAASRN